MEKCGTTFLNAAFGSSPDILTPRKKELFFFNEHYNEGLDWYLSWFDFKAKPKAQWVCDVTPSYFRSRKLLQRIKSGMVNSGMPAWEGILSDAEIEALWYYIQSLKAN